MVAHRYIVLAALLAGGSSAYAAPRQRAAAVDTKTAARVEIDDADLEAQRVAADDVAVREEVSDATPVARPPRWTFALGPYVWASSVQAEVSFGPLSAGVDLGFISLARHTRYGAEAVIEARRGRFGITGDVMYGAAAFERSAELASVMTRVTGKASGLLLDATASYEVIGDEEAAFSLAARSGLRYQRTTVQGELGVAGFTLQTPELVDAGADVLLGARASLRPTHALSLTGSLDLGVAGASDSAWSAMIDASVKLSSRISLTAGWRSLTMRRSRVNIELRGPRVALQFLF